MQILCTLSYPGMAKHSRSSTTGTNFVLPGSHHLVELCIPKIFFAFKDDANDIGARLLLRCCDAIIISTPTTPKFIAIRGESLLQV